MLAGRVLRRLPDARMHPRRLELPRCRRHQLSCRQYRRRLRRQCESYRRRPRRRCESAQGRRHQLPAVVGGRRSLDVRLWFRHGPPAELCGRGLDLPAGSIRPPGLPALLQRPPVAAGLPMQRRRRPHLRARRRRRRSVRLRRASALADRTSVRELARDDDVGAQDLVAARLHRLRVRLRRD